MSFIKVILDEIAYEDNPTAKNVVIFFLAMAAFILVIVSLQLFDASRLVGKPLLTPELIERRTRNGENPFVIARDYFNNRNIFDETLDSMRLIDTTESLGTQMIWVAQTLSRMPARFQTPGASKVPEPCKMRGPDLSCGECSLWLWRNLKYTELDRLWCGYDPNAYPPDAFPNRMLRQAP